MAELFQTSIPNVNMHIRNVFNENELSENATVQEFLIVRWEGTREVRRSITHYNLDIIISVGYRIKSSVATQFRIWATQRLREYIVKGFILDDERLKNPDLSFDYFEELLARIQDIRTVGVLMNETAAGGRIDQSTGEHFAPTMPWLAAVSRAVAAGELSVAAAEAIRSGLGAATDSVTTSTLTDAVRTLLGDAVVLDADRLFKRARALRDELDAAGTEQIASDGFLQLLGIAGDTAPTALIGLRRPAVRVLVTAEALRDRDGHGRLEGSDEPVSIETVERIACTDGTVGITFNPEGQPLDVGREQRLYTRRQRIALAVRDGGCRWPGCERPPAWTEAHHTKHWQRDDGRTDVADGVLLCRHHHLLLHNNHWEIVRDGAKYWLIPPTTVDAGQKPVSMPTHSPAMRDLEARRGAGRSARSDGRPPS